MNSDKHRDENLLAASERQHLCTKIADLIVTDKEYMHSGSKNQKGKLEGLNEGLSAAASAVHSESALSRGIMTTPSQQKKHPTTLKFITWNVDGLDERNIKLRTKAVCKYITDEQADIVFLQEVIPETAVYFTEYMTEYDCLFANEEGYFVGTLLKKSTIKYDDAEVIEFHNSRMQRNVLKIKATFQNITLCLLNSHLESLSRCSGERKKQLKSVFKEVLAAPEDATVVFGGDLNLRDQEVIEVGGLPEGIEDVWRTCGSPRECLYTFDTTKNDNLLSSFTAQCRFDRVYLRASSPPILKPTFFGLIGLERLLSCRCFPSDHWGILIHFEMED